MGELTPVHVEIIREGDAISLVLRLLRRPVMNKKVPDTKFGKWLLLFPSYLDNCMEVENKCWI